MPPPTHIFLNQAPFLSWNAGYFTQKKWWGDHGDKKNMTQKQ
jgi:hypothetical protein